MNNHKMSISKPIVSISELCQMLQLSRSRYYQLVNRGFFPPPIYDLKSQRPYYNADLQKQCLDARYSGIGANGSVLLFYSSRKIENRAKKKKTKIDTQVQEYADMLNSMGIDVSPKQVNIALAECFPEGTQGQDQGLVIRELYRYIKQNS